MHSMYLMAQSSDVYEQDQFDQVNPYAEVEYSLSIFYNCTHYYGVQDFKS